ncbi:unnamed protein product [Tuwongella immobilis]|uniref:Uncharacterized protein n=1 Tax=Tuwongella immobilis TaxID=692036 RepID=A0A6C2YVN1_9BACT|nr:unnamed protein product [Tuwongella immobilis]VTS07288.1 unnamed protein product [Tuwongella immobilis]
MSTMESSASIPAQPIWHGFDCESGHDANAHRRRLILQTNLFRESSFDRVTDPGLLPTRQESNEH